MEEELCGCQDTPSLDTPTPASTTTGRALLQLVLRVYNSQSLWFNKFSSSWPLLHFRMIWAALQRGDVGVSVWAPETLMLAEWSRPRRFLRLSWWLEYAVELESSCLSQFGSVRFPSLWVTPKWWESGKVKIRSSDTLYRIECPVL